MGVQSMTRNYPSFIQRSENYSIAGWGGQPLHCRASREWNCCVAQIYYAVNKLRNQQKFHDKQWKIVYFVYWSVWVVTWCSWIVYLTLRNYSFIEFRSSYRLLSAVLWVDKKSASTEDLFSNSEILCTIGGFPFHPIMQSLESENDWPSGN